MVKAQCWGWRGGVTQPAMSSLTRARPFSEGKQHGYIVQTTGSERHRLEARVVDLEELGEERGG